MKLFNSSFKAFVFGVLCLGLTSPAFATSDSDNNIQNAISIGNLNSGQVLTLTGDVTTTDDLEDFRKFELKGTSNVRLNEEKIAPNGGRTDLVWIRDANNNQRIDAGETIGNSRDSFSHQITRKNLPAGTYYIIVRNRQLNSNKVQYQVTVNAKV
ncbi:hypothetical protein NIES2101_09495 [Calothrix sp. HK-06]|nr:hypothetical protein NIES2101_09495 [Calothrix sp. HK-06]